MRSAAVPVPLTVASARGRTGHSGHRDVLAAELLAAETLGKTVTHAKHHELCGVPHDDPRRGFSSQARGEVGEGLQAESEMEPTAASFVEKLDERGSGGFASLIDIDLYGIRISSVCVTAGRKRREFAEEERADGLPYERIRKRVEPDVRHSTGPAQEIDVPARAWIRALSGREKSSKFPACETTKKRKKSGHHLPVVSRVVFSDGKNLVDGGLGAAIAAVGGDQGSKPGFLILLRRTSSAAIYLKQRERPALLHPFLEEGCREGATALENMTVEGGQCDRFVLEA